MGFHPGWLEIAASKNLIARQEFAAPALDCSEAELQTAVVALAKSLGWHYYHTHNSRRSNPGYPDLCLWRDKLLFIELKKQDGKLSDDQEQVIGTLKQAGVDVYVIRPSNFVMLKSILK